ncbi:MAG: C1 family peptidase [Bacteroidetes bacterium]|nr:C1 family peptidase [Bacteroidota bacterium]
MFRLIVLAVCLSFTISSIHAQNDTLPTTEKYPIGIESAELIDQLMVTMPGIGSNSRQMLEEQSVKTYMMPPRSSQNIGNPASYALATALEYYVNFDRNFKVNLSPDYINLSLNESETGKALSFLVTNGTVSAAIMPYGASSISPGVHATPKYRIKNFLLIYREQVRERQKTFETRKALMRGNPVLVEMKVPSDFEEMKDVREWEDANKAGEEEIAYLIVVGYDEDKEAFEVLGSYGSGWARNGYLWISYDDFGKKVKSGYVIVPDENYQ